MKKGDAMIRVMTYVIFIAIACTIAYSVYQGWSNPLDTVRAKEVTVESSVPGRGYAARGETPVFVDSERFEWLLSEGERAFGGQAIAAVYNSDAAAARAVQRRELLLYRGSLETVLESGDRETELYRQIATLGAADGVGDSQARKSAVLALEAMVLSGGMEDGELEAQIEEIDRQLSAVETASLSDTEYITAPVSGVFSAAADGFEAVELSGHEALSPTQLEALFAAPGEVGQGRLISAISWRFAAVMEYEAVGMLRQGSRIRMLFDSLPGASFVMELESVGAPDREGNCVLLFRSSRDLEQVMGLRQDGCRLILSSGKVFELPESALHTDEDGSSYIYVIAGLQARRVEVWPVAADGDTVAVTADSGLLYDGAEIITRSGEIYDGKVVR